MILLLPRKARKRTKNTLAEHVSSAEDTVLVREKSFALHGGADYRKGSVACSCFKRLRRSRSLVADVRRSFKTGLFYAGR